MKRVIEDTFPASIKTEYIFIHDSDYETIQYIDGNVALYETKNICDKYNEQITPEDIVDFCNGIADKINASTRIIVFDGSAPIQKLPEQIKRRKKRYETHSELLRDIAFDLGNNKFIKLLDETEALFRANNWGVISHNIDGEGEQKIITSVRNIISSTKTSDQRVNIVCWSKDWDLFVIMLNINTEDKPIALYLEINMPELNFLISINKCLFHLEDLGITPLHYMASTILFGCDFFQGIANIKLTPMDVRCILYGKQFVFLKDKKVILDEDKFIQALLVLQGERDDSSSSYDGSIVSKLNIVKYSNIPSKEITIVNDDCGGSCILCDTKRYCTSQQMVDCCYQYINMYMWTLNYFCGFLEDVRSNKTSDVYTAYIAPSISSLRKWLESYSIGDKEYSVNIIPNDLYKTMLEQSFNLEYYELTPCRYISYYSAPIICTDFKELKVFNEN